MVVDAQVNEANQTTLGSARRSAIKNNLTEPTLLEMSGKATCGPLTSVASRNDLSRRVLRENKVVGLILIVAGKTGFHERGIHRFAICVEMTEPPASRRAVLF